MQSDTRIQFYHAYRMYHVPVAMFYKRSKIVIFTLAIAITVVVVVVVVVSSRLIYATERQYIVPVRLIKQSVFGGCAS